MGWDESWAEERISEFMQHGEVLTWFVLLPGRTFNIPPHLQRYPEPIERKLEHENMMTECVR
jgi:hypothetical protein